MIDECQRRQWESVNRRSFMQLAGTALFVPKPEPMRVYSFVGGWARTPEERFVEAARLVLGPYFLDAEHDILGEVVEVRARRPLSGIPSPMIGNIGMSAPAALLDSLSDADMVRILRREWSRLEARP